jgi:GNAT superfamily N-acetyltransferase
MPNAINIREIDPASASEIALVAQRMRQTLVEVEGEVVGAGLYTMEWLQDRVRWHLDAVSCTGKVFLAVSVQNKIVGHTIVRVEKDGLGESFGLFSTTFVDPEARRQAVADTLLQHGERWMVEQRMALAATWTSAANEKLIRLYAKHGYVEVARHTHETTKTVMVKLEKSLA